MIRQVATHAIAAIFDMYPLQSATYVQYIDRITQALLRLVVGT